MPQYRKIEANIWNDAKFRELSDDAKLVFFFLWTHPTLLSFGTIRANLDGLAAELKWSSKRFREGFAELSQDGSAMCDDNASVVVLPDYVKYNQPANPNVVKSWQKFVDLVPDCELTTLHIQQVVTTVRQLGEQFAEQLPERFRKLSPEQYSKSHNSKLKSQSTKDSPSTTSSHEAESNESAIEEVYQAYPRHVGKADALKAISKALKKIPHAELLEAVTAFAKATNDTNKQFIPHPSTWFNGERWNDDRSEWKANTKPATNGITNGRLHNSEFDHYAAT